MTSPQLILRADTPLDAAADVVVIAARSSSDGPVLLASTEVPLTAEQLASTGFTGAAESLLRLPSSIDGVGSIAVIGLGSDVTADSLRNAVGSAVRRLDGVSTVLIAVAHDSDEAARALAEGALLGAYRYDRFRGTGTPARTAPTQITVHTTLLSEDDAERSRILAGSIALVKDLANAPGRDLPPAEVAAETLRAVEGLPLDVTIWDETELERDGFGGITGVGQGSSRPPRLVRVDYSPEGARGHIALVGKGITFDTGGISLKPGSAMVGMKFDMAGAATVLGAILAIARLELPVRVTSWLCLAENMPSATAIRPNDVLTIRGGKTVEVLNTDAEGRLVLADGLQAASEENPDLIIDVATLTGAAVVALGNRYAGLMGDDAAVTAVAAAAAAENELVWPMPLPTEMRAVLDSDVADIANVKIGHSAGGMLVAGVFLREFVGARADGEGTIPWAHLDVAGPADNGDAPHGFTGKGGTGMSVRTLVRLAEQFQTP